MSRLKTLRQPWYLIVALGAILFATITLVVMQYRSVRRTETQVRATLEANLDLHLLALVDEAKRDMVDRASYITHSMPHTRVRERDIPGIAHAFTRAVRRYPEIRHLFVVLFERGRETETWRVLRYDPPDIDDPNNTKFKGVPVGSLEEDADATEALRRAWASIPDRNQDATYTAYAPISIADTQPRQIFFHGVYEPDHMNRQDDLDRVGLFAFTADVDAYPAPDYLRALVKRYEGRAGELIGNSLGALAYHVSVSEEGKIRNLVSTGAVKEPLRRRSFEPADRLFPNLSFEVMPRDMATLAYTDDYTRSSILLGLGAAGLSFVGLGLTWRATRREMRVAQLKSDFLASMSHELKTPLTAIRAFGDLLRSGRAKDAGRVREYGEMITSESDRLTALLNNILEMSRLERGIRRYRLETNRLCDVVAASIEVFRHTLRAQGFTVEVELPAPPITTKFDESAIRQVMINLLSNAVKYSVPTSDSHEANRIEVRVGRDGEDAIIEVRDFGIGIALAEQRHIFEMFHRAPQSEVQAKRGTGLGLAIVREIVQGHGGSVSVESELGAGALFRLRLPLIVADEERLMQSGSEETDSGEDFSHRRRTERAYRVAR